MRNILLVACLHVVLYAREIFLYISHSPRGVISAKTTEIQHTDIV